MEEKNVKNVELYGTCENLKEEVSQLKVRRESNIYDDLVEEKCFLEEKLKKSEENLKKIY